MDIKFKLHPLFIVFGFSLIFFGGIKLFFVYFLSLILHELGHYFVAKFLGYKLNSIVFMPYGISLNGRGNIFKKSDEIFIAIAGPLINNLLVLLCVGTWWFFPEFYFYTEEFVSANLSLGLFNLLPFFPLDGGRMLVAISSFSKNKFNVFKVMKRVSFVGSVIFAILFFLSVFHSVNFTFLFIATFLLASSMDGKNNLFYERALKFVKDIDAKPLEVKTYILSINTNMKDVLKLVSGNYYVNFVFVDDKFNVIKKLTENELIKMLENEK